MVTRGRDRAKLAKLAYLAWKQGEDMTVWSRAMGVNRAWTYTEVKKERNRRGEA